MMHSTAVTQDRISRGIEAARRASGGAPSFVDTRSWYWWVSGDYLELRLDPDARPGPEDPDGRLLAHSCGSAVHHARVALAGRGIGTLAYPYPDPSRPDCVAWLAVHDLAGTTPVTERMCAAIDRERRCLVPRSGERLDEATFASVALAVQAQWSFLTRLDGADLDRLDRALVGSAPAGSLGAAAAGGSTLALLSSPCDDPSGWFNAGQAWSAARLVAADLGLCLTVLAGTPSVGAAATIHRELPLLGHPNFVLSFGRPV